jgi:hypothetical protein
VNRGLSSCGHAIVLLESILLGLSHVFACVLRALLTGWFWPVVCLSRTAGMGRCGPGSQEWS